MPRGIPNAPDQADDKPKRKTVRITIHPGPGNDMSDVLIGHNYVLNVYKRNVAVDMDEMFFDVLKHAVVTTEVPNADGSSTVVATIPQYSYSVE